MSRFGVDYSFARPTPGELKAAGVTFACRYIGTPSSGKNLTLTEAEQLRAAGIDLVANFEANNAGWMQGGRTAGVNAAKAAHADATRLGMPAGRPIYFSADYNATFDQYKTQIRPCLEGAASVIGTNRVGIYGGLEQVDWAYRDGVAPWVWQTYAWSYGQWSSHGHIQQYKNGQKLGSGTVDYDRAVQADFGQWSAKEEDVSYSQWSDADKAALMDDILETLHRFRIERVSTDTQKGYTLGELLLNAPKLLDDEGNIRSEIRTDIDNVLAAVKAGVPITLTAEQLDDLKAVLSTLPSLEGSAMVNLVVSPPRP